MKKYATLILCALIIFACEKEVEMDKMENPEPTTTVVFDFSKILGNYSGVYERELESYTFYTDLGTPPSYYSSTDSGFATIEVDRIGTDSIKFLNLGVSVHAEPGPLNEIKIDSLVPHFNRSWSGYGWSTSFKGYFHGEDLEFLHLEAYENYGTGDDSHETWDSEKYIYDLTKD